MISSEGQASLVDGGQQQWQHRFQPGETGRGIFPVFFGQGVRGMVGGKTVDHIQVFPQGFHILFGRQARAHFAAPGMTMRRWREYHPCVRNR